MEETDTRAMLDYCPLASQIWHGYEFDNSRIGAQFRTLADYLASTKHSLDEDRCGDSLSVMQECWNVRNHFIFQNLMSLGQRAIGFRTRPPSVSQ